MAKYKLGDICEIVSGGTPKTNIDEYWDGDIKWITPAEIDDDSYIIMDTVRKITSLGVIKTGLTPFPKGTVILSSRAPIGKVAIAGCEMYCNQGFKNLICSDIINNKYLYWFLKSNTAYLNSLGRGATFKEISKQIVANIEINLPDIKLQKKIVTNLEKISEIIKHRKVELDRLDYLIKARFVEMFGDPITNINNYPVSTLKDVAIGKLTYGSGSSAAKYDGNTRYIRITDINEDGTLNDDLQSPSNFDEKYLLKDGDILFARTGATVGKTYRYRETAGKAIYAGYLIRLVPDVHKVLPDYLFYFTKTEYYKKYVSNTQRTVAQPNINSKEYGDLKICLPPLDDQEKFVEFVDQVDKSKVVFPCFLQICTFRFSKKACDKIV